ncbi:hypothetical protein R3P38DRAFT_3311128 [Favolaschia claudopus]|uniref:Uncharacterized protein n=1 Tax=Favolaschia claudopus TaxID=2862362 RepID=A0AAW0CMA4_9AGAR
MASTEQDHPINSDNDDDGFEPPEDIDQSDDSRRGGKGTKRRRRSFDEPEDASGSSSKRPRPSKSQAAAAAAVSSSRKRKGKGYAVPKSKVPEWAKEAQVALQLLIRILLGCLTQNLLPKADVKALMNTFDARFAENVNLVNNIEDLVNRAVPAMDKALDAHNAALREHATSSSRIAGYAVQVDISHLALAFGLIAKAGLTAWAPDILGSFVFGYMAKLVRKNLRRPGSVAVDQANNPIYGRRKRLGKARYKHLKAEGFRDTVVRLAEEVECHSDDEAVPVAAVVQSGITHFIRKKPGRNDQVTTLLRDTQKGWNDQCLRAGKRTARVGIDRAEATPPKGPSLISYKLPKYVPIDFFTPEFFNALTVKERDMYRDNGIALPLASAYNPVQNWKTLDEEEFMDKYGNDVLKLYKIPTEEEVENAMSEEDFDLDNDSGAE